MPRTHRRVVWWACVAAVAGTIALIGAVPPYAIGDETAHLDYAYQLWHGRLPEFMAGLALDPGQGVVPPVQWVSQHPPLTYLLLAPVVGPLVDAGHPLQAAFAGRAVMAVLAVALVPASAWAARWLTDRWGRVALLVPVLVAANTWVLRLGAAVYNDVLLMLVVTLLFGMTARWIRVGRGSAWTVAAWCLLVVAAAATRLSGVPLAMLCAGVVAVSLLIRRSRSPRDWLGGVVLPPVAALAATGWFYLRNQQLTGSIAGGHPDWAAENLGRVSTPLQAVAVDHGFWVFSFRLFAQAPAPWGDRLNLVLFLLPAAVGLVAGVWIALRRRPRLPELLILGTCVAALAGVLLQQMMFVSGGGGAMARYLAVLILPIVALVALGLTRVRPPLALGAVLLVWVGLRMVDLVLDVGRGLDRFAGAGLRNLPETVTWSAVAVHGVALVIAAVLVVAGARRTDRAPGLDTRRGRRQEAVAAPVPG